LLERNINPNRKKNLRNTLLFRYAIFCNYFSYMTIVTENKAEGKSQFAGFIICLFVAVLSVLAPFCAKAETPIDAVLLIDASGSMRLTDPKKLRLDGARSFIDSLDAGDRLALVDFADQGREIRSLTEKGSFDAVKLDLLKVSDSGEYTDILLGLTKARELLSKNGRPNARKVVLLISDGKMDPRPEIGTSKAQTEKLFSQEIPAFKSDDIRVFSLAFSQLADQKMLSDIAAMTGGAYRFSPDATGIESAFSGLIKAVDVDTQGAVARAPSKKVGKISRMFKLSEGLEQAIFYVNRGKSAAITLLSPSQEAISQSEQSENVLWHQDGEFDFVTIQKPEGGEWVVSGLESKENFATVLSNLKLGLDYSSEEVSVDEPLRIEAKFFESRKPINLPSFFRSLSYSFQVVPMDKISEPVIRGTLHDDGKNGDIRSDDGVFATEFTLQEPGIYRVILQVEGPTVARENMANFKVTPRLLTIKLAERDLSNEKSAHGNQTGHEDAEAKLETEKLEDAFKITLSPVGQAVKERLIKLRVTNAAGAAYTLAIPGNKNLKSEFIVPASLLPGSGTYDVQAQMAGSLKGRLVSARSNTVSYVYTAPAKLIESVEVIAHKDKTSAKAADSSNPLLGSFMITLINLACGLFALSIVKKHLMSMVVEEEHYASPEGAVIVLSELDKKYAMTEVDLSAQIFAPANLTKILQKAALTEAELQKAVSMPLESASPAESSDSTSAEPKQDSAQAEIATAETITEAQAESAVESELDEETRRLLEQVGEQVDKMRE
jgi:uncharacterized protein (TIGR03503 family)